MIKNFSADYVLPVNQQPIVNGVVSVADTGEIVGIYGSSEVKEIL